MDEQNELQVRLARVIDFQAAMLAGAGQPGGSQVPDESGAAFDAMLKSGEFAESYLDIPANTLWENIQRLRSQATLPMSLFNYGRRFQEVYTRICIERGRDPNAQHLRGYSGGDWPPSADDMAFMSEVEEIFTRWIAGSVQYTTAIGQMTSFTHVAGVAGMSGFMWYDTPEQIEGFCSALVIQAWTVFESLSEDLWVAALNSHPTVLAALSGSPRSIFLRRDEKGDAAGDARSAVSFNDLQANAFAVRSKMGTILSEKASISFRSLPAIRSAYHKAFSEQYVGIDAILDDPWIQYASAVRNLLVHKRGLVDKEFQEQTARIANVPRIEVEQKFPITGQLCADLSNACRSGAIKLVNAVHAWIKGHPEKMRDNRDG